MVCWESNETRLGLAHDELHCVIYGSAKDIPEAASDTQIAWANLNRLLAELLIFTAPVVRIVD